MNPAIPAITAILHEDPTFLETLSDEERAVLPYMFELWMRPEQYVPLYDWRYYGTLCGRGWGKTMGYGVEINRRVRAGELRHLGLMAPTEVRADKVQIQTLIDTAPPWDRPVRYRDGLVWPNGADAIVFTPEAPERSRSENLEAAWLTEILDWQESTAMAAFDSITTATRIGAAQVLWDTTSKGRNAVIAKLFEFHAHDPIMYPIQRGTMFANSLLTRKYIQSEVLKYSGRRLEEELLGRRFTESGGASFQSAWLDGPRVDEPPTGRGLLTIVSLDPALSVNRDSDETGIAVLSKVPSTGHVYMLDDRTDKHAPEAWGDIAVSECVERKASGCVIERNHAGDPALYVLRSRASNAKLRVRMVERDKPFPAHTPGVMYVREVMSASSKTSRGDSAASECEAKHVHLVGHFAELEQQLLSYDGTGRSPNRYDAFCQGVIELMDLAREKKTPPAKQAEGAKRAHDALGDALRGAGQGRLISI